MPDDYPSDATTDGIILVGGSAEGEIEELADHDWFRVTLQADFSYDFIIQRDPAEPPPTGFYRLEIFNAASDPIYADWANHHVFRLMPYTGDFYMSVGRQIGLYTALVVPRDIIGHTVSTSVTGDFFWTARVRGAIEVVQDSDMYQIRLSEGVQYTFDAMGSATGVATLSNPFVQVKDENGIILGSDNDSGQGNDARLLFTPGETKTYYVTVWDAAQLTGSYLLTASAADDYVRDTTTTSTIDLSDGAGIQNGTLEFVRDIDWHRVNFEAGRWYRIKSDPIIGLRDPQKNFVGIRRNTDFYFKAQQSADHYVVIRNGLGHYEIEIQPDIRPYIASHAIRNFHYASQPGGFFSFDERPNLPRPEGSMFGPNMQVYSTTALAPNIAAHTLTTVDLDDWRDVRRINGVSGLSDVYFRAQLDDDEWTSWVHVPIVSHVYPEELRPRGQFQTTITFAFADSKPSYFENDGRINGFEQLTDAEKQSFRDAIQAWDETTKPELIEVDPGAANNAADVMVFKSSIAQPNVWAIPPNVAAGSDIIINRDSPLMKDLSQGNQGFYELLRGIGFAAMGLPAVNSLNRESSIMGLRQDRDTWDLVYPSTPMPLDIWALEPRFGVGGDANKGDTVYELFGSSFYRTISDFGGTDTIDASRQAIRTTIDLRPGQRSFTGKGHNREFVYVNSLFTFLENAIGGMESDKITGNELANRLFGGDGDDWIEGGKHNDWLFGGRHSDTYLFRPGHGNDIVDELMNDGRDRIRYAGFADFDSLPDDLTFRRDGSDLVIGLEQNSNPDPDLNTVRIKNMGNGMSRVEVLELWNETGLFARVSLPKLFEQVGTESTRFELAPGNDNYGSLVVPV